MTPLVIYHGSCRDGFCAAWVLHQKFPGAEFVAAYYGKPAPNVKARDVIMVDFSYPLDVMTGIANEAKSLLVLDHHKTAQAALDGFEHAMRSLYGVDCTVVFDMERSGAGLAWDHFFPREERPWPVDYVEDRDLWRHALLNSETVNAYIGVLPFEFSAWTEAAQEILAGDAYLRGKPVRAKVAQYIAEASKNARHVDFEGMRVPCVNAPQVDISELLSSFCDNGAPVAMGWWQRFDGLFQFSLRSRGDVDVSEIAKKYGGGGHKGAAGFQLDTLPAWISA